MSEVRILSLPLPSDHTWEKQPSGVLIKGLRYARYLCPVCRLSFLELEPDGPWALGQPSEVWDGVTSCADIVAAQKAAQQKAEAQVLAAQEAERQRVAAGGAPAAPLHERIAAAQVAAAARAGQPGRKR